MINLLYAEARFNVLKGRYPCDLEDAVYLGGLIIHSYVGRYNPAKHTSGYISSCLYKYVLPGRFHRLCSSSKWESALGKYHSKFKDLTVYQARYLFVSYVRRWPTYGSSYFPICVDRPLSGFFELRTQLWYLGINVRGIFVFDAYNYAHLFDAKWKQVKSMQYSADTVKVVVAPGSKDNTKSKKKKDAHVIRLLSPQAPLIYNLATKCRVVNILERLSYNTREHSDLEVLMKPMGSLNPNLPQAPISKKESDEFDCTFSADALSAISLILTNFLHLCMRPCLRSYPSQGKNSCRPGRPRLIPVIIYERYRAYQ